MRGNFGPINTTLTHPKNRRGGSYLLTCERSEKPKKGEDVISHKRTVGIIPQKEISHTSYLCAATLPCFMKT